MGIASELQTRNAWLLVPLSSNPMGTIARSPAYRRCLSWTKITSYRRFPLRPARLPVSDLKECPYTVVNLQVPTSKVKKLKQG